MADIKKILEAMDSIRGLHIGDPVVVTGEVQHKGETGDVVGFNQDQSFVIIDLYNHGRKSFHSSDVSYNDYVDPDHDEDMYVPEGTFAGEKVGQKPGDQVRGTEKATKKKNGEHPFKGRLVGAAESKGSLLKDLEESLKQDAPKRNLAEEFAQFKEETVTEFAVDPKYWRDDDDGSNEFTDMQLADIAKTIMLHIGDEFTVEKGKRRDQPSYKFTPKDPTKFGMAKIWCGYDRRGGEYPTYHTNLYSYYSEPSGRVIAAGKMVEKLVRKNNTNAQKTAELIYSNTAGALPKQVAEDQNPTDTVTLDVPLMIRMLEYAREDAKTDMDLHDVAERMISLSAEGRTLTMQDYDKICPQQEQKVDESTETVYPGAIVVKTKKGREVGEIYPMEDRPGQWGAFHYGLDFGADMIDTKEDALAELRDLHDEYVQGRGKAQGAPFRSVDEAKGLKKRVRIVQGTHKGQTGTIGEVRHGLYKGAPKTYTIDLDGGGNVMLPGTALRLIKEPVDEGVETWSIKARNAERAAGKRVPLRTLKELADTLDITIDQLRGLRLKFPGFPAAVPGIGKSSTVNYYRPIEFKKWVIDNNIVDRIKTKKSQTEVVEQVAGTAPAPTAGGPAGSPTTAIKPQGATAPAQPGQAANPQQIAQSQQQKANLQKNIAQLKTAGVNIDPARAAQTLQKTDTGAPMNAQDKDTLTKLAPALGNVLGRPDLSSQLNTLIKKAGGGAQ